MAGLKFTTASPAVAATNNVRITGLQALAPANQRVKIRGWSVQLMGVLPTGKQVLCRLIRNASAGTLTNTESPGPEEPELTETIQTVVKDTCTAEPSYGAVLDQIELHPQFAYTVFFPYGDEKWIGGGGRVGIDVLIPSGEANISFLPALYLEE